jgi:predicted Zn-dependent peptidase
VRFPAIEKSGLPNGLTLWTVRHAQVPVVAFALLIRRGASSDPGGKHGLAAMTADMLDAGSGNRSAIEMHEAIARLGTQLETDIGSDGIVAGFTVLSRFADQALALLADVVVRPAIREDDVLRVRQLRLHRLTQLRDVPSAIADRAFLSLIYGEHPYGHSPIGTELSLASMSVEDVRAFHDRAIRPSVATLIAVGTRIMKPSTDWRSRVRRVARAAGDGEPANPALPRPPRLSIVPRPSAPQSELRIGHVAVERNTPDYHA